METHEVKEAVERLNKGWDDFKKTNEERLSKLEKGRGIAEQEEKLAKLNEVLDRETKAIKDAFTAYQTEQKARQDALEALVNRGGRGADGQPEVSPEQKAWRGGFTSYLRREEKAGLRDLETKAFEAKAMTRSSDPQGGYWVEDFMSGKIVERQRDMSPMESVCEVVTISTDAFKGWTDVNDVGDAWEGETENTGETTTADIGQFRIPVHELRARPRASQQFLEDSSVDVESYLARKVGSRFARSAGTAFVTGSGTNKPRGFATYSTAATADSSRSWGTIEHVASGSSGTFGTDPNGFDKLIDLIHKQNPMYREGSVFMMPRATLATVRKIKSASSGGSYAWTPGPVQTNALSGTFLPSGSLLGYPVVENEDVPAIAANALAVWFGNFREAYLIVKRLGISVLRDPYTAEPLVKFVFRTRVGGAVVNFDAIKCLKLA